MTRAELAARWGQYCNTDELVNSTMLFLRKNSFPCTEIGVLKLLNKYFENKQPLIELFRQSNHYMGNMRIMLDVEMERANSGSDVYNFCSTFLGRVDARQKVVKTVDDQGKKMSDYLMTGYRKLSPEDLRKAEVRSKLNANKDGIEKFNYEGETEESVQEYTRVVNVFNAFQNNTLSVVSTDVIERSKTLHADVELAKGMKTSRAFNRICTAYGIDKAPSYNKLFAHYADLVAGGKVKYKFFMSLNPLDYMTMSFGVNWTSCHSMKNHGGWCSGCISYMLDPSSIVTFVHHSIPESVEDGKIYRNMFHFQHNVLIQSRIYPKANDGAIDLYQVFRGFVQEELSELLGLESNTWVKRKGPASDNIVSVGTQYPDYNNVSSCNASYPKERSESAGNYVHIGHNRICTVCGEEITDNRNTNSIIHYNRCPNH